MSETVLVTGATGFIGSHFIEMLMGKDCNIVAVDKSHDSQERVRLARLLQGERGQLVRVVNADLVMDDISELLEGVDIIVHFAAKTFVDHSFRCPMSHVKNNIIGTARLLKEAQQFRPKLFVHISTDEVYGDMAYGDAKEDEELNPTNPYSATKTAAEMLVRGWANAYKMPVLITRCENNYGPWQHKQKVLPVFVRKALADEKLPVYGDGKHVRMWLRVEDHCAAIWHLVQKGFDGVWNIGAGQELENIELARRVLMITGRPQDQIEFIDDGKIRPYHDKRYSLDTKKLEGTGWKPKWTLEEGLTDTVLWFVNNEWWLQ